MQLGILLGGFLILAVCLTAPCFPAEGPYPPDIAEWDDEIKQEQREAGVQLLEALQAAIDDGESTFTVPEGHYRFAEPVNPDASRWGQTHIAIRNASNMVIDGSGSTFWFETGAQGINLTGCSNVTVKNLYLDWDPLPYTQGEVLAVDPTTNTVELELAPGYERVTREFAALDDPAAVAGGSRVRFQVIDAETGRFKRGQVGMRVDPFWDDRTDRGTYKAKVHPFQAGTLTELGVEPGDRFISLYRDTHGVQISGCDHVTLEDITLYAAPFIGFMETATEGRTTYRRCRIVLRPETNRLLAGNADGFQIANAQEGPLIDECEVDSIGDDFVNPHGYYYRVLAQESPTSLIVDLMAYRGQIEGPVDVRFLAREDWTLLGWRTATVQEQLSYAYHGEDDLLQTPTGWAAGGLGGAPEPGQNIPAQRLILDEPIDLPPDAVLAAERYVSGGTVIRGCRFVNGLATGLRIQAPGTVIENNHIEWNANSAIHLLTQPDKWGESSHPDGTVVRNNTIIDAPVFRQASDRMATIRVTSPGDPAQAEPIRDIEISGNTLRGTHVMGILGAGVEGLVVQNNIIEDYATGGQASGSGASGGLPAIRIEHATGVTVEDNSASGGGEHAAAEAVMTDNVEP